MGLNNGMQSYSIILAHHATIAISYLHIFQRMIQIPQSIFTQIMLANDTNSTLDFLADQWAGER